MTYKEACEYIAASGLFPKDKTAEDIFKYSPTGELFMIPIWYDEARKLVAKEAV